MGPDQSKPSHTSSWSHQRDSSEHTRASCGGGGKRVKAQQIGLDFCATRRNARVNWSRRDEEETEK